MLYTQKTDHEFTAIAEKVVQYAEKTGYEEICADFDGYDSPSALKMVNNDVTFTPDFSAKRGDKKFFFELAVKNDDSTIQQMLISKWKALEAIAKIKGGFLQIIIPNGIFKFATSLVKANHIEAKLIKIGDL